MSSSCRSTILEGKKLVAALEYAKYSSYVFFEFRDTICGTFFFVTLKKKSKICCLTGSSLSDISDQGEEDSFCLDVDSHTKYSVWVSFCEIYNENIYDLLEPIPNGSHRRTVLRLSQDIKGNTFVKGSVTLIEYVMN